MADDKMEILVQGHLDDLVKIPTKDSTVSTGPVISVPRRPKPVSPAAEIHREADRIVADRLTAKTITRLSSETDPGNNADMRPVSAGGIAVAMRERGVKIPDYLLEQVRESKKKV